MFYTDHPGQGSQVDPCEKTLLPSLEHQIVDSPSIINLDLPRIPLKKLELCQCERKSWEENTLLEHFTLQFNTLTGALCERNGSEISSSHKQGPV